MKKNKNAIGLFLLICIISLSAYSAEDCKFTEAGFFSGIWDGLVIVFTLIGKLFSFDIEVFAKQNSGSEYWAGCFFGVIVFCGSIFLI